MEDDDLGKRIKRLESDVLGYKTTQPVGTDSVRAYTTQSNNIWDITTTVVESYAGAGYGQSRAFVRFKAAHQVAPFGRLRWQATVNGVNYRYDTSSNNFNSAIPYGFSSVDNYYATAEEINDPTMLRWNWVMSGPTGAVIRVKFFVEATDSGRLYWREY
jgi:hypothetical protein